MQIKLLCNISSGPGSAGQHLSEYQGEVSLFALVNFLPVSVLFNNTTRTSEMGKQPDGALDFPLLWTLFCNIFENKKYVVFSRGLEVF